MANHTKALISLLVLVAWVDAYWRMSCSIIQTGRVDPVVAPGAVSAHVHKLSGASNINIDSSFESLQASRCTSCEVQDDKSAYWTPQLFYQHANGSFQMVPNGGTVVYYLGRGENRSKIEPFPPGFKMVSGDNFARSYDSKTKTYSTSRFQGRPVADRVSFACLDSSGPSKERNYMWKTDCDNGMRAQIHFQSCWNGQDYQADQSHIAYMSQIDNGICPPTHPRQLAHLFFEVIYGVNNIDKSKGGRFVFANGDTTGYAFHGDFLNGWNTTVLAAAIKKCINNDSIGGAISKCPVLAASQTPYFSDNCPEMAPLIDEPIRGMLDELPGCNVPTTGPGRAAPVVCSSKPAVNDLDDAAIGSMFDPAVGDKVGSWAFVGCALEGTKRTLNKYAVTSGSMSIEYCTASCKAQGYPLAGMENGRECYCAGSLTPGASYIKASTCASSRKMTCVGNMTQYCGGPDYLTVWNDTSYTPPVELIVGQTQIAQGVATYYGCWAEGSTGRALASDRTADVVGMTNEKCVAFCQAGGYSYAGTEYSQECYCGNDFSNGGYNTTDISQCSMQCKGNIFSYCGAGNRLSVWKIKQADQPAGPITALNGAALWSGCYTDGGPGGRTLPSAVFTGASVSLDTCFSFCNKLNYPLFGMEYGRECYCGYAPKTQATLAPDGDCRMPCAGDSTQKCGAGNRISIWNNTLYTPTVSAADLNSPPKYLGCYTEGKGARALGDAKTTDKKMSVDNCAAFCSSKGYHYLGLENGQDCYCSKKGPSSGSLEVPESECSVACKGKKSQKCGATNRLNVYKLDRVSKISSSTKTTSEPVAKVQDYKTTSQSTTHRSKTTLLTATTKAPSKAKTSSTKLANAKSKQTTTASTRVALKAKVTTSKATSKAKTTSKSKPETTSKPAKVRVQGFAVKTKLTTVSASSAPKAKKTSTTSAKKTKPTSVVTKAKIKASNTASLSRPKTTKPLTSSKGKKASTTSAITTSSHPHTASFKVNPKVKELTASISTSTASKQKAEKTSATTTAQPTAHVLSAGKIDGDDSAPKDGKGKGSGESKKGTSTTSSRSVPSSIKASSGQTKAKNSKSHTHGEAKPTTSTTRVTKSYGLRANMGCDTPQMMSPALQKATLALMTIMKNETKLREANNNQAESIKQIIHPFNKTIDDFEMSTLYLGDLNDTKYYYRQVREHIGSIRRLSEELGFTLASIGSLDSNFDQQIKPHYAQFLRKVMSYTGDDTQVLVTIETIAERFQSLNKERQARLTSMSEQLGRCMTAMTQVTDLKHILEGKKML
ncbi:hypothetical protein NW762_014525 [Fusarium torreyae]|uniref:WSC domain-containing protein n=1 Tax=Fusarium torreyae TaxID=1237075 RepID=A0A9W8RLL9_9HYPO|nr:hypothetical protein NW762_014525 [Fusarium torreyae]